MRQNSEHIPQSDSKEQLLSLLREYNLLIIFCLSFPSHGKLVFLLLVNQIFVLHKVYEAIPVDRLTSGRCSGHCSSWHYQWVLLPMN